MNKAFAKKLGLELQERFNLHARFPGIGRDRGDIEPGLRSFSVRMLVVLFRPTGDSIEIARVFHGAEDIDGKMKSQGPD